MANLEQVYFELFDELSQVTGRDSGDAFMQRARELYGLSHIAYLGVNIPGPTHGSHYVHSTYADSWEHHYVTQDYVSVDPVVRRGLTGLLPLDWRQLPKDQPKIRRLFDESREAGIGRQGLTFPLRGRLGETAIFSINADVNDREWAALRRSFMRDFQIIATYFHNGVLAEAGNELASPASTLSPRERECLKWAAAGKTDWAIGKILSISERTARFYLDSARSKLNALTRTQAVAKAVALGLIDVQ